MVDYDNKPLELDIYGTGLYNGNFYYNTPDGKVAHDNMDRYIISKNELIGYEKGWVTYFDDMQGNIEEYDTIKHDGHYLCIDTVYEYLDFVAWHAYEITKEN